MSLRQAGFCRKIVGCSRSDEHLQRAVELGIIDEFTLDPVEAVADMVTESMMNPRYIFCCEMSENSSDFSTEMTKPAFRKTSLVI